MTLRLAGFIVSVVLLALAATTAPDARIHTYHFGGQAQPAAGAPRTVEWPYTELPITDPNPPLPAEEGYRRYGRIVDEASRKHGVDRALVHAVIFAESNYDSDAVSRSGAQGLMQLMPDTAREHGVSDPFDPVKNVQGGVRHLKRLLDRFDGDVELALAAYNAGVGNVLRAGNRIPDNPQTTAYVPKVLGYRERFTASNARS